MLALKASGRSHDKHQKVHFYTSHAAQCNENQLIIYSLLLVGRVIENEGTTKVPNTTRTVLVQQLYPLLFCTLHDFSHLVADTPAKYKYI